MKGARFLRDVAGSRTGAGNIPDGPRAFVLSERKSTLQIQNNSTLMDVCSGDIGVN